MKTKSIIVFVGLLLLLSGCSKREVMTEKERVGTQYAQFFAIEQRDTISGTEHITEPYDTISGTEHTFTELRIYNPWEPERPVLQRYYLCRDATTPVPSDGIRVQVPVERIATGSCTHVGFVSALCATDALCGVTDKHLVFTPLPNTVTNLGDCISPDAERFMAAQPDLVFMSAYSTNDAATARLQKVGLTIVPVMEWVENDPVGRAEWVRFFGAFLDKQQEADSLFLQVASRYANQCKLVTHSGLAFSRSILSGGSFRGTWYVPSGSTYMGRLFHDAGARYAYAEDRTNGSVPLGMEQVLQSFREADVWVGAPANTMDELRQMDIKHTWFKAYQDSCVYTFNARVTPTGGNDFWEAGVCEPDVILSDLIAALYPSLLGDYKPKYLYKLR